MNCSENSLDSRERYVTLKQNHIAIKKNIRTSNSHFSISDLQEGDYVLEYLNIFGQLCSQNLTLNTNKLKVELCTDHFIDTKEWTYFDNRNADTLTVEFNASGCFHNQWAKLEFFKKNDVYKARLQDDKLNTKEINLNEKSIAHIALFFRKLQNISNGMGGCTTSETYILRMKGKKDIRITDDTCDWSGFSQLRKVIFKE